jgi:hypothetical protein
VENKQWNNKEKCDPYINSPLLLGSSTSGGPTRRAMQGGALVDVDSEAAEVADRYNSTGHWRPGARP